MKNNILKSIFISLILLVGGISKISGAAVTFTADDILFFNMSAVSWWTAGTNGNGNFAYFYNNSEGKNAWSAHAVQYSGDIYYVKIPAGTWEGVILTRNNTSTAPSWDNKWNQTGDIPLSSTSNYISKFSEGSTSVTWSTQKPTSTGSLAASATSVNIGSSVTLTPSLTSNTTYNEIKSTSYSISPSSGASISSGKFTATKVGTYTVTATVTYNPRGYSSLTSTVSPTVTITVKPWTITWDANGGSVSTATSEYDGATAVTLPTPTRTGYNFDGWYTAASGGTKINDIGTTTKPTANVTYHAHWTPKTYAITLNANGGASNGSATATYNSNSVTNATYPTRDHYECTGYYTATSGGTLVLNTDGTLAKNVRDYTDANGSWIKDDAATLHAQWTINQYTINYGVVGSANGAIQLGGGEKVTKTASTTADYSTSHTFTAEPNKDYKIEGWYSDVNGAKKIDAAGTNNTYEIAQLTDDIDVYVKFVEAAEVMSKVTVEATAGGSVDPSGTVEVGNKTSSTITATPAPGYRFVNWTTEDAGITIADAENSTTTITATAAGTVTAHFVRVYTVNFFATPAVAGTATATVNDNDINSGHEFDAGTEITFTAIPANKECNFIKWVDGAGTELSTNETYTHEVTDDITVKGIFTINQYTLTFSASEGGHVSAIANNSAIASPATLDYNTSVTLTATPNANCEFAGWYEGSTKVSSDAAYTINLTADKTLEARFTKGTTIFFKPVDYWKADKARLAVYMWNSAGNKWIEFEDYSCNEDIYTADIPAGYTDFKFVRLRPATADGYNSNNDGLDWDNKWGDGETENLTVPTVEENLYDMTKTYIHLKPNSNWTQANARFAAYFFGNEEKWVSMTDTDGDGVYSCEKPSGFTKVILCRMNPANSTNNWNNKWNKSADQTILDGNNCFTVNDGAWGDDKTPAAGSWSKHWDGCQWTTYAAPSYKLTIQSTANGTVAVSKVGGGALANNETIKLGDEIKITFTPADGYELSNYLINYASETETDGVYTVCGPTKIIAEFDPIAPSRTVYLRPNEDWLRDNPIMAARVWKSSGGDDRWYVMNTTDEDYTGAYSCKIPSEYDKIIFVRLNPNGSNSDNDGFNWTNAWNQTKGLTIIDKDNDATNDKKMRFAIGDKIVGGDDNDRYDGKWEENTPIWGLIANFNDWKAENAVFMGYPGKLNTVPPFTPQHVFKLYNFIYAEGKYFGNAGTMQRANSGQWWTMVATEQANCQMKLDAKGDYIYQLRFLTVGPDLRKQISVTYPAEEMYYLNYVEGERWSYAISNTSDNTKSDKVSFFVPVGKATIKLTDANRAIIDNATQTFTITEAGVYNFTFQHGATPAISSEFEKYTGNYYVRTDAATGGWNVYKQEGNRMTYSSYSDKNQNFDHYFCKWIDSPEPEKGNNQTNVKFCVANDYSHALSDELNGDEIIEKDGVATGCLPDSANVRFAWDSKTNELSRAYISGSAYAKDRFLVLEGNEHLKAVDGSALNVSGLNPNEAIFADRQNWIYQLDVQANPYTDISLTAKFNDKVQTFFGTAKGVMQATNENYHKVRMIYDFKTNNLVAAWLLDQNQTIEAETLASNILIIRENQGSANQITFANENVNKTVQVNTAYGVMTFTKTYIEDNSKSQRERSLYWISFPFDVKIDDVFGLGIGEYADQWIIQRYNGAARAEKGLFSDSGTYWEYIFDGNTVLNAGEGYVLVLDLNKIKFLHGATDVSLYFPSLNNVNTLSGTLPTEFSVPEHWCKIDREWTENEGTQNEVTYHHEYTDSHWNLIGVPALIDQTWTEEKVKQYHFMQDDLSFYYNFNLAKSEYTVQSTATTFQAMYAYMVQFAGIIDWSLKSVDPADPPAAIAARRYSDEQPEKVVLRLELAQGEEEEDHTFVQLQQEGATSEFDLSVDLTKIINSGANIYTLAGEQRIQSAGNALPMEEAVVPVGVDIATAGEYTFRMPDGTEGMVVELIDYEANTRTNLLLSDYTVTLQKGTSENRFALHIQPQKDVVTSLENIGEGVNNGEAVNKYLIDGKLFIRTADGVLYDAQGHRL